MGFMRSRPSRIQGFVTAAFIASLAALGGCTRLGPVPGTTGVSAVPAGRPDVTLQVGGVPGYYLSDATQPDAPQDVALAQVSGVLEPERWIGVPGLLVGARIAGPSEAGASPEPLLGYRTYLDSDKRLALAGVGFGTYATGQSGGADFTATRLGAEGTLDVRLTPLDDWLELHVSGGAGLTSLDAEGHYCVVPGKDFGVDCDSEQTRLIGAKAGGLFPSLHLALALESMRHFSLFFHGLRLELTSATGTSPVVLNGRQAGSRAFVAGGFLLSASFGAAR